MRHRTRGRRLNRVQSHRTAMLRNLVCSLFEHGRVITTPAKAKEARPLAEKLITIAKEGTLAARRRAISLLANASVVKQLFAEIAPRYAARPGGYSRILHLDTWRIGDGGDKALFELVEEVKGGERVKAAVATDAAPAPEANA